MLGRGMSCLFFRVCCDAHCFHVAAGFGGAAAGGMPMMGGMGMNGMNMGMNMGAMNGAANNATGGDGNGGQAGDNSNNNANNLMANQAAFGGFNPMGGFQGGFPMMGTS